MNQQKICVVEDKFYCCHRLGKLAPPLQTSDLPNLYCLQYTSTHYSLQLCFTAIIKYCNISSTNFFNYSCVVYFYLYSDHVPLSSLIFSNTDGSRLYSDIKENSNECHQNLYCGPFRNRNPIFAILPDEESEQCKVFCELFYIFFSSAIGLPLLFCLM